MRIWFWGLAGLAVIACGGSSTRTGDDDAGAGTGGDAAPAAGGSGPSTQPGAGGDGASNAARGGSGAEGAIGSGGSGATGGFGAGTGTGAIGGSGAFGSGAVGGTGPGDPNGMPIDPPGPVLCAGIECAAGFGCCIATTKCFDLASGRDDCPVPLPDGDGRAPCASNAHCPLNQFCMLDSGLCQGTGHCQPIDNCGGCGDDGTGRCRVCGCDGNTYPNQQTACMSRATVVAANGAGCGETVIDAGGGEGGEGTVRTFALCASNADCGDDSSCCPITGHCYPNDDAAQCRQPPSGARFPCTSDAQCYSWEYCAGDGCEGPGGCKSIGDDEECGVVYSLVCGCDGTTYTSAACAATRGVRVATAGECD